MEISDEFQKSNLLPTPEAKNQTGYHKSHGRKALKLGTYISSQAAFPASLFPKQDEDSVRKTIAIYGRRCYESYESFIRGGSSVKMLAASLLGAKAWYSNKSTLTWKVKVTKSKRLLFQLFPSTPRTEGIESGLLLTPAVVNIEGGEDRLEKRTAYRKSIGRKFTPGGLAEQIKLLKTPSASDGEGGIMEIREGVDGHYKLRDQIPHYTKMMPTPNARDTRGKSIKQDRVPDIVEGHNLPTGQQTGLKLQPTFVEWMMGYPKDWTEIPDSRLLEMRSSRRLQKKSSRQLKI